MPRHVLHDDDLTPAEQAAVLDLADAMRKDRFGYQTLAGPEAGAVLFDMPSLRTRIWEQAENRRHAQKALISWLLEQT